jgi:hypothetical protein
MPQATGEKHIRKCSLTHRRIPHSFILLLSFYLLTLPALNSAAIADDAVKVKLQAAIVQGAKALKDDIKWSIVAHRPSAMRPGSASSS